VVSGSCGVNTSTRETNVSLVQFGNDTIAANTVVRFLNPGYRTGTAQTNLVQVRINRKFRIVGISVRVDDPSTDTDEVTFTVMLNGVATSIAATGPGDNTDFSDTGSVNGNAGDELAVRVTKAAVISPAIADVHAIVELVVGL
jgi:hypothetical protein